MTGRAKEIIGGPVVINGRRLSLSKAVRAGDIVYLTGQIPMRDGAPMTDGSIEEQTRVVKSTVWLKERADFAGFNHVYGEFFTEGPPARSALVCDFLVDIKVEVECVAYKPL